MSQSLDKDFILELARLDFVRRRDDVVITGKAGTGKSHILKACGLRARQQQISLRYARCVDLLDDLHSGLADGTYPNRSDDSIFLPRRGFCIAPAACRGG